MTFIEEIWPRDSAAWRSPTRWRGSTPSRPPSGPGSGVFPQRRRWRNPKTGEQGRHHCDPSVPQRALRAAVLRASLTKRATCHTLGHCFATHLPEDGVDVRTLQELLGDADLKTTMLYTHVLSRGPGSVRTPLDRL